MDDDGLVAKVRARVCGEKVPLGAGAARDLASRLHLSAYRCPFAEDHRHAEWHVGHTPSLESLELIARALRARSGNAPGRRSDEGSSS